jgi:putative transposase
MCSVLKVSRSGYYQWKQRPKAMKLSGASKFEIDHAIAEIWRNNKKRYGAPRIRAELNKRGIKASRQRVQRRMKHLGLSCVYRKKYRAVTSSNHDLPISPNVLDRQFEHKELSKAWVSDITYLRSCDRWVYLTTVMDLADRQIIGWSLSTDMTDEQTVIAAFRAAVTRRKPNEGMIFHSDRGSQYASADFRKLLGNYNVVQSMSRKANCWDNAVAESFFKTLKTELRDEYKKLSVSDLKTILFEYIEIWYNRKRLHSTLGYKTPVEMEKLIQHVA